MTTEHMEAVRRMEAERIERVRTNGGGNASDHGPTCRDTPIDHRCGDTESDQGGSWESIVAMYSARIQTARGFHVNGDLGAGATSGYCVTCQEPWPCQTAHVLNGWGTGEGNDGDECFATGWCSHAGVKVPVLYESLTASDVEGADGG